MGILPRKTCEKFKVLGVSFLKGIVYIFLTFSSILHVISGEPQTFAGNISGMQGQILMRYFLLICLQQLYHIVMY